MVISFSNDFAFSFLETEGYVATFRAQRRKRPNCETWCNRGRGEPKEFDVRVTEVGEFFPTAGMLDPLAGASGFDVPSAWVEAIQEYHSSPEAGWVYLVTRQGTNWLDPEVHR